MDAKKTAYIVLSVTAQLAAVILFSNRDFGQGRTPRAASGQPSGATGAWVFKELKTEKKIGTDSAAYFNHKLQTNTGAGIQHTAASHLDYWRRLRRQEHPSRHDRHDARLDRPSRSNRG